jgi:tRNA(Ile2) C34 agmatinyltransferase TiaS
MTLPKPSPNASARESFAYQTSRAKAAIARLQELIAKTEIEFEGNYKDHGYAGSVGHVASEVESLCKFLAGEDR